MSDPAELDPFVELARARLAAGAGYDEVLGLLRQRGLSKMNCLMVISESGLGLAETKRFMHESRVWAAWQADDEESS
ncbi:hypothetical protein UK23_11810 [Lentzea aerocolonigenes]|uniref:Uncharacterized protein n=1 Tax=Lentzea aerocolonigenes TaxID=68170 RepID=A0A0F0H3V4_LENAE|nr:hypothetical protein [Lentzea aerocolonigenes]KJK50190.1 hypothetical protein UK23_11810 [Lentzea aerocolonigenes]